MNRAPALALVVGAIAAVAAILWYVTAPPKGTDGYLERAAATSESLRSQVQTARIWADTHEDGRATGAATLVGFQEAEADANAALAEFEGYEPPSGELAVRAEVIRVGDAATGRLADVRIAAELENWAEVSEIAAEFPGLAAELDRIEERTRP